MMDLVLEAPERDLLLEILRNYQADLRDEVYRTEAYEYKESLKERKKVLQSLLEKIEGLSVRSAT